LQELVGDNFKEVDLRVAFKAPKVIGDLFPFKSKDKDPLKKFLVVYKIKCKGKVKTVNKTTGVKTYEECSATYIGKTNRILKRRVDEHKLRGSVAAHNKDGHEIDYENVKVIDSADTPYKLLLKETMHITLNNPELNIQSSAASKADPSIYVPHNVKTLIIRYNNG
jgi:hypothetical protein